MRREDWLVLAQLVQSESGLQPYTLHRRLMLEVSILSAAIYRLVRDGFAEMHEEKVRATPAGLKLALSGRHRINGTSVVMPAGHVDSGGNTWELGFNLPVNSAYVPRRDLM